MTSTFKRIGLFFLIYFIAFVVFKFRAHAQTAPAPATAPAAAASSTPAATAPAATAPAAGAASTAAAPVKVAPAPKAPAVADKKKPVRKMFAEFDTSMGKFKAVLYTTMMPRTVANFVGLAEGTLQWTDPKTHQPRQDPFYNGLTFHRIVKNFVIQGGDPLGDGTGGPGFKIKDEYHPNVNHDKVGVLSMANAGPDTSGSQFFITLTPQPNFDKKPYHFNAFGEVVEGLDVVKKIGAVPTDLSTDRPREPVYINSIKIIRQY